MTNKVAIIIPVYNRIEITKTGLNKLRDILFSEGNDNHSEYKIIVIDDGSTDGTSEWIHENFKDIILLRGNGNLWWSGAVNKGAMYALEVLKSDYVLLWNDDTSPSTDYFINLNEHLKFIDQDTILGSHVLDELTKKTWFKGAYYSKSIGYVKHIKGEKSSRKINCLTGMGTLVPAKVVLAQHYWDATLFPQYYGDLDFTLRSYNNHIKLAVMPDLVIYNYTKYSSFNQDHRLKNYLKSLTKIQSRYNIRIEILFHKRHSKSFIWRFTMFFKHSFYLFQNIIKLI